MAEQQTATVHIESLDRYIGGPARCFRLNVPHDFGDRVVTEYVVVALSPATRLQAAEALVFPADAAGNCLTSSLIRRPGSFTLHDDPDTEVRVDGAYWLALLMLGYTAVTGS